MNPQPAEKDWKSEAQFWQLRYFELQQHTNQVIAALSRAPIAETVTGELARRAAAQGQSAPPAESNAHGKLSATAVAVTKDSAA